MDGRILPVIVTIFAFMAITIMLAVVSFSEDKEQAAEPIILGSVKEIAETGYMELEWVEVNPPPEVEGPCFAYFHIDTDYKMGYGFSGVFCPNN